ncbi:hypothetical protein D1953_04960, partial [Peribacillus asahii]
MLKENIVIQETEILTGLIARELVAVFGKSENEANELIEKFEVKNNLIKNPILLHDSPNHWALALLTNNNDVEAIEKYLN